LSLYSWQSPKLVIQLYTAMQLLVITQLLLQRSQKGMNLLTLSLKNKALHKPQQLTQLLPPKTRRDLTTKMTKSQLLTQMIVATLLPKYYLKRKKMHIILEKIRWILKYTNSSKTILIKLLSKDQDKCLLLSPKFN